MYTCWLWSCYDESPEEPTGFGIMAIIYMLIAFVIAWLIGMFAPPVMEEPIG